MGKDTRIQETVHRVIELGAELEAPGVAATEEASLVKARAVLHQWIDQMIGIVVNPALGRVTVIHENGSGSSIASAELAFEMSAKGVTKAG
jgi:hypothetical protein